MENLLVVIPAIKKNAVIPDQLIKKLNGITLIQRAINTALELTTTDNILVITDSEEISLICERNGIQFYKESTLSLNSDNMLHRISSILGDLHKNIFLYRANVPLLTGKDLKNAYSEFLKDPLSVLVSVKKNHKKLLTLREDYLNLLEQNDYYEELKAFYIFSNTNSTSNIKPYIIELEKSIEIENYQDWWVCEKVLQRKKIVFNVIGSVEIGMGHIYHSLALAHEITNHEILFVCDEQYKIAVDAIASMDYKVISTKETLKTIFQLNPDLVINDILDTEKNYITALKEYNIKVVNFEDLGEGSQYADLVFNELYDTPQCDGKNYCWGYEYLALRDEFYEATPHRFIEEIKEVLITFGGADQNNLTLLTLEAIVNICRLNRIKINIVCGRAYAFKEKLENYLQQLDYKNISLTFASGVISKIMEKTQLAISSNGRTVYELADMNIPSIVVSHHEREATHGFANLEKGFINLGIVNDLTKQKIEEKFEKLVEDRDYRELLFMNIKRYTFRENKQKVVQKILELV